MLQKLLARPPQKLK